MTLLRTTLEAAAAVDVEPAKVSLAEARLIELEELAEIELTEEERRALLPGVGEVASFEVRGSGADVQDGFHQFLLTEMASWFGLDYPDTAANWNITSAYDDDAGCELPLDPSDIVFPCIPTMCMGWSWALHFCNAAVGDTVAAHLCFSS